MIIIFSLLFLLFLGWTYLMKRNAFKNIDNKIYSFLEIKDYKTSILKAITTLAATEYFVILAILLVIFLPDKKLALVIASMLIIDSLIVFVCKHIVKRERPNILRLVYEKGYSYPSGHTTTSTCFYGFMIFLVVVSSFPFLIKVGLILLLLVLILLIGFSRIYLGVHYFSDVIGGIMIGSSYVIIFIYFTHIILKLV